MPVQRLGGVCSDERLRSRDIISIRDSIRCIRAVGEEANMLSQHKWNPSSVQTNCAIISILPTYTLRRKPADSAWKNGTQFPRSSQD
ncbi:Protein of unknown function [Pyronema omphalodes CBS 100304]|uniref:Uncharacterized protein n=1 Tax=Pyronema omphalodes (strain CBS 100304) TaxID=1076935 RepID=U4LKL4_PYROM|nr:Protein of unknown function [Pyronema omphalodes CBS 100304]